MPDKSLKIPYQGSEFFLNIADGNMVSLNSVYEMAGAPENQSPYEWSRLPSTKSLIESMSNENTEKSRILKSKRGRNGGTWAHWQLALSYAQYLSPELHLAVNGVFKERLEEMVDPELGLTRSQERARKAWKAQGKSDEWIAKREQSKQIRDVYVSTLIDHDVKPGSEIGHCTNQIYKGLFLTDSAGLEYHLRQKNPDLPKKINIRDHAKLSSLAAISLAEALSSEKIEEIDAQGVDHCAQVSHDKASSVRMVLEESRSKDKASLPPPVNKANRDKEKNRQNISKLRDALKGKNT